MRDAVWFDLVRHRVIHATEDCCALRVHVVSNPLAHFLEVLRLEVTKQVGNATGCRLADNVEVENTTTGVTLEFVQDTTPVWGVTHNQLGNEVGVINSDVLILEYAHGALHELLAQLRHVLLACVELDDTTTRVQWFDDLILEVAGEDEATVVAKLLDEPTQCGLG